MTDSDHKEHLAAAANKGRESIMEMRELIESLKKFRWDHSGMLLLSGNTGLYRLLGDTALGLEDLERFIQEEVDRVDQELHGDLTD